MNCFFTSMTTQWVPRNYLVNIAPLTFFRRKYRPSKMFMCIFFILINNSYAVCNKYPVRQRKGKFLSGTSKIKTSEIDIECVILDSPIKRVCGVFILFYITRDVFYASPHYFRHDRLCYTATWRRYSLFITFLWSGASNARRAIRRYMPKESQSSMA